jgi:hypothetical protein
MRVREHRRIRSLTRRAVLIALVLVPLWAAHAPAAAASFDLQASINACYAQGGGTVNIPAGTFTFTSPIALKSGVALQGAGIDQTILVMPARSTATNLLMGAGLTNAAVRDLTLNGSVNTGRVYGIHIWNDSNVTVERVKTVNCFTGIKLDTQGSGFALRDWTSRGDALPFYVSNHTDSVFQWLDVADADGPGLYISMNNHDLHFDDVKIANIDTWGVQLWYDGGWDSPSDNIRLSNFDISGRAALVIGRGYTNVTVSGLTAVSTELECVRLYDPHDVLIEDFACAGGPYMLGTADDPTVPNAQRVTLRNGTYTGVLVCEPYIKITNLTLDAVNSSDTTTTRVATTRYEQNDAKLTYLGTWYGNNSAPNATGGRFRYTNVSGASVTVKFTGTYLAWITKKSPVYGVAEVFVDGQDMGTVDLYSSGELWKQKVWDTGTLSRGTHTVTITCAGAGFIGVDAFDVAGILAQAAAPTRYEQNNSAFAYVGTWYGNPSAPSASGGSFRYTNVSGASVTVNFTGTYLAWITKKSPVYGVAEVFVDGQDMGTVDLYSSGELWKQKVWDTGTLSYGTHTVTVLCTGDKNVSADDAFVGIDAFDIIGTLVSP